MRIKKGFTLIELVAVLVILAILALIVTPLVLNIIRKARISADKRSIDAYGRSIELAVANYLLETTNFPTSIDNLKIEYKGDEVVCSQAQLKSDSSVYLAGCTVGGRSVDYIYGKISEQEPDTPSSYSAYSIGDEITYNNVNYYVIKDSNETESSVTLLKAEPLTYEEVGTYSAGTGLTINNENGYGEIEYGATSDYETSYVKQTVDAWKIDKAPLVSDARLLKYEELINDLGYENNVFCTAGCYYRGSLDNVPTWIYNSNYDYWTMSSNNDSKDLVWIIYSNGALDNGITHSSSRLIRPVVTLKKSIL